MTTNRVALVTGSRRGIGRAIALTLAREGYDLVINDYQIDQLAEQTAAEIRALGRQAHLLAADLGDTASIKALVQGTVAHFGRIDVLVNNAATWEFDDFVDIPEAHWDKMLAVDLKGPFTCSQAAAKQMSAQGSGGAIINISSVHSYRCWPQDTVYGICKAAIIRLTESMAFELGPRGIRVNAIAPGYIDSRVPSPNEPPIGQPDYAGPVVPVTPMRRIGVPDDIAEAAAFLVSDRASFITGQCLTVDGGFLLGGVPTGG
ncbi:MAG: 3-oxoacyl-ACP reductase FabG [Caldilineaceae bacterium]|nr:3-oxoacyl-ACP reductase FabG [Caldilineaceae bacterium]